MPRYIGQQHFHGRSATGAQKIAPLRRQPISPGSRVIASQERGSSKHVKVSALWGERDSNPRPTDYGSPNPDNTYRCSSFLVHQVVSLLGVSYAAGLIPVISQVLAVNKR